jgi:hypothetical protein
MKTFLKTHRTAILVVLAVASLFIFPFCLPLFLMALAKDRTGFSVKGGGIFKIKEVASGGAFTTMDFLGWLKETAFDIDGDVVQFRDEAGRVINQLRSTETWKFTIITPQVGIDVIDLLRTANGKFFHVYYQGPLMPNGKYQEIYIPLAAVTSKVPLKFSPGERTIQVEVTALMPKGVVTVTPAGFNVAADTYGVITETATTPLGEVTTATGTIYTAAV